MKKFNKKDILVFGGCIAIAIYAIYINQNIQAQNQIYFPHPLSDDEIKKYSNTDPNAVVIYPVFTQMAYKDGGFYDYWKGICKTCTTVSLQPLIINASYVTGLNGLETLEQLHYGYITDIQVDKHPEILNDYDKVILLHNEYMTQAEFNAVKNHKNVVYLYPNSMYAEIKVDYSKSTMTIVRGHSYPDKSITNGFGYVTDTKLEYDLQCKNYTWLHMPNGIQPTCWPEFLIKSDRSVLQVIKDFPNKLPDLINQINNNINVSNMGYCDYYGHCTPKPSS